MGRIGDPEKINPLSGHRIRIQMGKKPRFPDTGRKYYTVMAPTSLAQMNQ
jgi:hypothetical protein